MYTFTVYFLGEVAPDSEDDVPSKPASKQPKIVSKDDGDSDLESDEWPSDSVSSSESSEDEEKFTTMRERFLKKNTEKEDDEEKEKKRRDRKEKEKRKMKRDDEEDGEGEWETVKGGMAIPSV